MVGNELSEIIKLQVILHILLGGMSQREAALATGVSLGSVSKVWREFCDIVTMNGLLPVLESMNLPGPVELAELAREMRRHQVTPRQCNQVLPLVIIVRDLRLDPHLIPDLLEAALRLGGKDFPREEYAAAVARIRRRERETGLPIEQLDAWQQAATADVVRIRVETGRLQTDITHHQATIGGLQNTQKTLEANVTNLRNQSAALTVEIQGKQSQVNALDALIASEGTTRAKLSEYADDKQYFAQTLKLDIRNLSEAGAVFRSLAILNYNPRSIIEAINRVGDLQATLTSILSTIKQKQDELQALQEKKKEEEKEAALRIHQAQRDADEMILQIQQAQRDADEKILQIQQDADSKIAQIQQNLNNKMKAADATEELLARYVADREKLRAWGLEL